MSDIAAGFYKKSVRLFQTKRNNVIMSIIKKQGVKKMFRKKLFGNNIAPDCTYCLYSEKNSGGKLICRYGSPTMGTVCQRYMYDPLKREPKTLPDMPKFTADDFKL